MATALDVAKYLLTLPGDEDGDLISNLKLQKLLYYCQGFALAILGRPLFNASIKAWIHGPVVPEVWHAYRMYGSDQIPLPADYVTDALTAEEKTLINDVYEVYGQFSGLKLRKMTHAEPPWAETAKDAVIAHGVMLDYFKTQIMDDDDEDQETPF